MTSWPWKKTFFFLVFGLIWLNLMVCQTLSAGSVNTERISGIDRYATAAAISGKGWKTSEYAVLARGDIFADALCAGPLAYKYKAPILLAESNQLNNAVLTELQRLKVKNLIIMGGINAISQNIENTLKSAGIAGIERICGDDRYSTSVKVAEKLGFENGGKVVLATGNDYPDALSISVVASRLGLPILLTDRDVLPQPVSAFLAGKIISQTYVIGGTEAISNALVKSIPNACRLAGDDRYATNVMIMEHFANDLAYDRIYVARGGGPTGNEFADALTGSVLAAQTASPLVLVQESLPPALSGCLRTRVSLATKVIGLGGEKGVAASALESIQALREQSAVEVNYSRSGAYGPEAGTGSATISGNAIISSGEVTLRNTIVEGDLLLAQSIGKGNVSLYNVTVKGKTIVNGGGANSVLMYNFNGQTVIVDVPDGSRVRLVAQGTTSIDNLSMESAGSLEEANLTGSGFLNVTIPVGVQITMNGLFQEVDVQAVGTDITVAGGNIAVFNISENAGGTKVNLAGGTAIKTLTANAPADITGQGQITSARVNSSGVTIQQNPASITVADGITSQIGGRQHKGGASAVPSGGGGGGSSDAIPVCPVTGVSSTAADGYYKAGDRIEIAVTFSRNIEVTGNPILRLETGTADREAAYSGGSGSSTLLFTYHVQAGDASSDLDYSGTDALGLNGGTIIIAGTPFKADITLPEPAGTDSLSHSKDIVIDTTAPGSISISIQNAIPGNNGTAMLTVVGGPLTNESWTEIVNEIIANTGEGNNWITGISGCDLTILPAEDGNSAQLKNGSASAAIIKADFVIPAAKVIDRAGNTAAGNLTIDSYIIMVSVTGVTATTADGHYKAGSTIAVKVTFNDEVTVTGTPGLYLETGTIDRLAMYSSGSGTTQLAFNYVVQAGDTTSDLDYTAPDALILNGGTIELKGTMINADLTLAAPGQAGSLGKARDIVIDTTAPTALNISAQNTIPGGGAVTLTAINGPLSDDSWYSILAQIKTNTITGNWISGISAPSLTITVSADGASAALNNTAGSVASIVKDFALTASRVVDKAGNTASSTIVVNSCNSSVTDLQILNSQIVYELNNAVPDLYVAYAKTAAQLKSALTSLDDSPQTYRITDSANSPKTDGGIIMTGDKFIVTAENGTSEKTFPIRVAPEPVSTIQSTNITFKAGETLVRQ